MVRNLQYWKEIWQKLTKKIQLEKSILEGETTFKAATANGNPEEQYVSELKTKKTLPKYLF